MRKILGAVLVASLVAPPAHAAPLILTLAEAQIETSPDPSARPSKRTTKKKTTTQKTTTTTTPPASSDVPPLETNPQGEVITPIGEPKTTTTTTTTAVKPATRTGGLTGIQWAGIGLAVIAVGALAASGGGGDEPAPPSSGGN